MLPVRINRIPLPIRSDRPTVPAVNVPVTRRRTVFALGASLALTLSPGAPGTSAWAQTNLDAAASFMNRVGGELAAIVGGDTPKAEKQQKLQSLIDRAVDVDEIARFCLGRFWRQATPDQQREYLQLFRSVLVLEVVVRLGDYQPEKVSITIGRPEQNGEDTDVPSTVERAGNPPAQVTWVLQQDGRSLKIIDLVAEGVSMRLTVRSDYDSFVTSHNNSIEALLSALRRQAQS